MSLWATTFDATKWNVYLTSDIKGLKGTDCCLSLVKSFNLDVYHLMPEELTEIFFLW